MPQMNANDAGVCLSGGGIQLQRNSGQAIRRIEFVQFSDWLHPAPFLHNGVWI